MVAVMAAFFLGSGCAALKPTPPILSGQTVKIDYVCRIEGKGIVDTTMKTVAENNDEKKARVFIDRDDYKPIPVVAGENLPGYNPQGVNSLRIALVNYLAHAFVGKTTGKYHDITLHGEIPGTMKNTLRFTHIEKELTVSRFRTVNIDIYRRDLKKEPKIGDQLYDKDIAYAEIVGIDSRKVTLKLLDYSRPMDSPWGPMHSKTDETTFTSIIDTCVGTLVRSDTGAVGRVAEITDDAFVVDFGDPFGGYPLKCRAIAYDDVPAGEGGIQLEKKIEEE